MFRPLILGFRQLADRQSRRVIALSVAGGIGVALALVVGTSWTLAGLELTGVTWLDPVLDLLGGAASAVIAWLLFPVVVGLFAGLFVERISRAVERRYYPDLPDPIEAPWTRELWAVMRIGLLGVVFNLLLLPVYLFVPGISVLAFFGLNGYLLGQEYFRQVAVRRLDGAEMSKMMRRHSGRVWIAGVVIAVISTIPVVNLIASVVGTAFITHVFEDLRRRRSA